MTLDREIADKLREQAKQPTTGVGPKLTYRRAATEIEARDRILEIIGGHLEEQNEINKFLLTLESADAELLMEYFGWTQYFGCDEVFSEGDEDEDEESAD